MKIKYDKTIWWKMCREKLKREYQERGITSCELKFDGCMKDFAMSFHHRHKRWWYINKPDLLGYFNQTVLTCASCHQKAEASTELTKYVFKTLRNDNPEG